MTGDWREHAACRGMPIEIFMPERGYPGQAAKQVCHRCPVMAECLDFALRFEEHEIIGVWGGTTGSDRRRIRYNARNL